MIGDDQVAIAAVIEDIAQSSAPVDGDGFCRGRRDHQAGDENGLANAEQ